LLAQWHKGELDNEKFSFKDTIIYYKKKVYIGGCSIIKGQILHYVHSDPMARHSGYEKSLD